VARTLTLKRIGGLVTYHPMISQITTTVHWGRVWPDYEKRLVMHTACGWSTPAGHGLASTTHEPISCKRCAQYGQADA
jgi:hypothetical protein